MAHFYDLIIMLVPEDELVEYPGGSIRVPIACSIQGAPMECSAMLQNMAADIMTSIKNELAKAGSQ